MIYFDSIYWLLAIPGLAIAFIAQLMIMTSYNKYSKVDAGSGITGIEAAKKIATGEGFDIDLQLSPGKLNDFFNPVNNVVNLSADNQTSTSVANIAVVAHEFGHVQQKYTSSLLFGIRTGMVPAVNIGSSLGYILFMAGILIGVLNLAYIGLALFSLTTIFTFITVPIEIDASIRGMNLIKKYNLIDPDKLGGAKRVLSAAALTYVAALVQSLGQLLYFFMLVNRRRE
jgi:uncharacterized protein